MAGLGREGPGENSKVRDCLSVWHQGAPSHTAWGMQGADERAELWTDVECNVVDEFVQFCHQGLQPYVNVDECHDTPFCQCTIQELMTLTWVLMLVFHML